MASLYRKVARALPSADWYLHWQGKGSHEHWRHTDARDGDQISVPSNVKKIHTAEGIMKNAGLPKNAYLLSRKVR